MKFKVCTLLMCLGICTVAVAQDAMTMLQKGVDLNVVYNNEADFFIGANTAGFEMGYRRSHHINGFRKGVFEIEGLNKNSAKQIAVTNPNPSYQNAKSYNYGQINDLFILRVGYGFQQVKFRKAERKSIEIRYAAYGGLALGILKPVYLEVVPPNASQPEIVAYNPNDPNQSQSYIYGGAPFTDGLNNLSFVPGLYAKFALSFEYGESRPDVKALEVGLVVDAFPVVIQQMAFTQNHQVFPSLYVDFVFGKKWF